MFILLKHNKYDCICGSILKKVSIRGHLKTQKHTNFIQPQKMDIIIKPQTRYYNGYNETINVKFIINNINNKTKFGVKLIEDLNCKYNIQIDKVVNKITDNRKTHYDFIVIDNNRKTYKIEYKGSKSAKYIGKNENPWKNSVQFANIGCEKFQITKVYAYIWYEKYIKSGYLSKTYLLDEKIPTFNTWYENDCCTQGNPKTLFGKQLKLVCKKSNKNLKRLRNEINYLFEIKLNSDKKNIDNFSKTVLKLSKKYVKEKDLWLQINGNLQSKNIHNINFKWYRINFDKILDKIIKVEFRHRTDFDFICFCKSGFKFTAKLRWGKGCGFSNLRVDLK